MPNAIQYLYMKCFTKIIGVECPPCTLLIEMAVKSVMTNCHSPKYTE